MEWADTLTISSSEGLSVQLAFLIMVHLLGLLLNLTCLFVICTRYKALELKRRYILLGNLLLCDFVLLFWVVPVTIRLLTCSSSECRATVLHPAVCTATAFTFQSSYLCGMVTQVFLALDRTMTIAHPCLSSKYLTRKVYVSTVAFSWAFAGLHASLPLVPELTGVSYVFSDLVKKCTHSFLHSCWYYTYINILVHGILAPSMLFCYLYMAFRIWQLRRTYDSEQVMLMDGAHSLSPNTCQGTGSCNQKNGPYSRTDHSETFGLNPLSNEREDRGDFIPYTGGATLSWAQEASEAVEIFQEFLHVRRQPMAVTHQGIQTSLSKLTSSLARDELDEGSRTSETLNTVFTWQSGPFVDTTIASLTSQALSQLNYVPSDVSDLKGFIQSQHNELNCELSSCTFGTRDTRVRFRGNSGSRRHGSKTLSTATVVSLQHGICLVVISYVWSLPYTVATKCPRGEIPFAFSIFSMWLCYSSCIFYPLVYFFMHENFLRHLRVSISSL